jgi:hypothetical protein
VVARSRLVLSPAVEVVAAIVRCQVAHVDLVLRTTTEKAQLPEVVVLRSRGVAPAGQLAEERSIAR